MIHMTSTDTTAAINLHTARTENYTEFVAFLTPERARAILMDRGVFGDDHIRNLRSDDAIHFAAELMARRSY